jgi:peptidoglycan/LPS O-acetylase OafA/YrhL
MNPALTYRPDIDGLRALAIVPVVLFHLGVPGFSGGFLGVDIFFVVSGFLITRLLQQELDAGSFSFGHFWLRRARRLLPTLVVVLASTVLAGFLFLEGDDFRRLGRQCLAVTAFLGNVWVYRNAGDYWGPGSEDLHLLHCWSLAVEEQFYLLFPFVLVLVHRRSRYPDRWLLGIAILSFAVSVPGPWRNPAASFFLPHARAWELLVGALLARRSLPLAGQPSGPVRHAWVFGGLGAFLLLVGFCVVRQGPWLPGPLALFPTVGAALVIAAGPASPVNRWLASPIPVYIGRISYAWYLWHWPVMVFLRKSGFEDDWSTLGGSFALASLSYHAIECPARRIPSGRVPVRLLVPAAACLALCCAIPRFVRHPVERVPIPLRWCDTDLMPGGKDRLPGCTPSGLVRYPSGPVVPATPIAPGPIHAVVLGDSHGRVLLPALDSIFRDLHWNYAAFPASGTRPMVIAPGRSWTNYGGRQWSSASRHELDASIRKFFATTSPPVVIVVARWSASARVSRTDFFEDIRNLRALAPESTFLFVGQVPELAFGVGSFQSGELEFAPFTPQREPRKATRKRSKIHGWLRELAAADPRVRFLDIAPLYQDGPRVRFREGSTLLYFDDDHLTNAGAARAEPLLREALGSIAAAATHPVRLPRP